MYGASLDDVKSLAAFAKDHELAFPLLSDPDGSAADKYGVRRGKFARRVTFVIDTKGVLRLVDENVDVSTHGSDLAEKIYELSSAR